MKKVIVFFFAAVLLASCVKQSKVEEPTDNWNGYFEMLKLGDHDYPLLAGRTIPVGHVTYGLTDTLSNSYFYVVYTLENGWTMSEAHVYAGDKLLMPLNKMYFDSLGLPHGNPKVGRFPHHGYYNPRVSSDTFYIPLTSLPPYAQPGFAVAAHCVVRSLTNQTETAWANGGIKFTDKNWGWYNIFYYDQPNNPYMILYGTGTENGYLVLYQIDVTNNTSLPIWSEYVGNNGGSYDAAAYDNASSNLFFVNYTTGQLWVNKMDDDLTSILCGTITGVAQSATFFDESYYYVNANNKGIYEVQFNTDMTILGTPTLLSTIPNSVTVSDIAMSPTGTCMYIIGDVIGGGASQLIKWDITTNIYYTMSINVEPGSKIAFGPDDQLYAISETNTGGGGSVAYMVDTSTGVLTPIKDGIIIIDDTFSDLSSGRIL